MEKPISINAVDRVEILTLQDNFIDITAMDGNDMVSRAFPFRDGELKNSVLAEHGFSALVTVTTQGTARTMLFDFGFSTEGAAFNAAALGVDMGQVEAVALSHGHTDHLGGFEKLAGMIGKRDIEFTVHPKVFHTPRYLKLSEDVQFFFPAFTREIIEEAGLRVVETKDPRLLLDGAVLFLGEIPRATDFEKGMPVARFIDDDGEEKWDAIEDDTSVVMNLKGKGLVILSGCAHAGIINTIDYARAVTGIDAIHAVMGGFHLSGPAGEAALGRTVDEFKRIDPSFVIPTHCTGRKSIMLIEREMPDRFVLNMSGTKLTFAS